ncbi:hypothetical protein JXA32_11510 [Candidatus Sumerlaeota bacterium]|nr:hypothetical protein [Candidatus Sumerlaeota bacterium]
MKIGILITARLKSTRLPKKVLREIKGRPMLSHLLDRMKRSQRASSVTIITSPLDEDQPLVQQAQIDGVDAFCGDPDDVLKRMRDCAVSRQLDLVVSCTADNPFVDPVRMDQLIDYHIQNEHGFSRMYGVPWGTFCYTLSRSALERACEIKDEVDTEVWGGYFTETGLFRWGEMAVEDPAVHWPDLRLTVDYPEDFEMVSRIFDELYEPGKVFTLEEIVALCRRCPDIVAINANASQAIGKPIKVKTNSESKS